MSLEGADPRGGQRAGSGLEQCSGRTKEQKLVTPVLLAVKCSETSGCSSYYCSSYLRLGGWLLDN